MSIGAQPTVRSSNHPLGANGDRRRRFLLHHLPLALASAVVLAAFMTLPLFDVTLYPHADMVSGPFPRQREGDDHTGSMGHGGDRIARMRHGGSHTEQMNHGEGDSGPGHHSRGAGSRDHRSGDSASMDHGGGAGSPDRGRDVLLTRRMQQLTVASGYVALGLLGLTLLIGPANLLLRRRVPISNYLSRDVGTWAAIFSVVHVIVVLLAHVNGSGLIASFLHFFVTEDGKPLTNSFGLGNWTGLVALVVVVGLLAISSDFALRKLKARLWKRLQRLNYALFALVILHAFFYGALLRVTSPFTLLLGLCVIAVFVGQAVGVWLWRQRFSRTPATVA